METKVQLWGNSLAIRIPKAFALQTKVGQDSLVNIDLCDGKIIVTPVTRAQDDLESLLAQITPEKCHKEWESGLPAGSEAW